MAEPLDFDTVVTDDALLSSIFAFLEPKDVVATSFVNTRWKRVALNGAIHTPLDLGVAKAALASPSMARFQAFCALRVFNLLRDPYFDVDPPRFPINVFGDCSWPITIMGASQKFKCINPDNDLPGGLGEVAKLRSVATSWDVKFKDTSKLRHRVVQSLGRNLVEWTQVLDLTKELQKRGFTADVAEGILDEAPPLGLSIWIAARCPSSISSSISLHRASKKFPPYNTPQGDAFTRDSIKTETYTKTLQQCDIWRKHSCVLEGYGKGARQVAISFRTKKSTDSEPMEGCIFGSPCLLVLDSQSIPLWRK